MTGSLLKVTEVVLGRELRSLVYWWKPDVNFLLEGASAVVLPPYDPGEHSRKVYRTGREKIVLTTWAAAGMDEAAYRAHALADALSLSDQEIDQLLLRHRELATSTWDTACRWLRIILTFGKNGFLVTLHVSEVRAWWMLWGNL